MCRDHLSDVARNRRNPRPRPAAGGGRSRAIARAIASTTLESRLADRIARGACPLRARARARAVDAR